MWNIQIHSYTLLDIAIETESFPISAPGVLRIIPAAYPKFAHRPNCSMSSSAYKQRKFSLSN